MPKRYNVEKEKKIIEYLNKIRKASMYEIGAYCETTASGVQKYLENLIERGIVFDTNEFSNGRGVRFFSIEPFTKKEMQNSEKFEILKNYTKSMDLLVSNIMTKRAELISEIVENVGINLDEFIILQKKAYEVLDKEVS